jgi:iodotyrosine deiodinase
MTCLLAAGTAPNGANLQPWRFAVVGDPAHTPSLMSFLNPILGRPQNERPFLLLVTGYPADVAQVPGIIKKPLDEIATFYD